MNKAGILIAFTFYAGINAYLFIRGWQSLPANSLLQVLYSLLFVISSASFFVAMGLGNRLPVWMTTIFENIGAFWVIGLLYFILAALFADLLLITDHFTGIFPDWIVDHYKQVKFIYLLIVLGLFTIFSLIGYYRFTRPTVKRLNIEMTKMEANRGGFTIVAASDIHLGNVIRTRRLEKFVELLNRQDADVILLAGDLIDHSMRAVESRKMDQVLRKMKARHGVYAIMGNHDYYAGAERAAGFYARSGITLLRDEAVTVDNRFVIIGREDLTNRNRKSLNQILEGVDKSKPLILLDHNPAQLSDAEQNGIDLQISGHTHNGQIFPINLLIRKMYPLPYGYRKTGNTNYYVSSGLGLWAAPVRIGTRGEILVCVSV